VSTMVHRLLRMYYNTPLFASSGFTVLLTHANLLMITLLAFADGLCLFVAALCDQMCTCTSQFSRVFLCVDICVCSVLYCLLFLHSVIPYLLLQGLPRKADELQEQES
jgi:hypothetical protein